MEAKLKKEHKAVQKEHQLHMKDKKIAAKEKQEITAKQNAEL